MVKCPFCGYEASVSELKSLKEWRFRFYDVKMIQCSKCGSVFNYYHGLSPRGKTSEFIIKVNPRK